MSTSGEHIPYEFTSASELEGGELVGNCKYCKDPVPSTKKHLHVRHLRNAVYFETKGCVKFTIPCFCKIGGTRRRSHWHCPVCSNILTRAQNFKKHLLQHGQSLTLQGQAKAADEPFNESLLPDGQVDSPIAITSVEGCSVKFNGLSSSLPTSKEVLLKVEFIGRRMADNFLMEVCVDSVESAVNAERGGAGRLELCTSLLEGGLTPSIGLLQIVKQYVKIPVYVMIRPRGGDFLYSDHEVEVMKRDIELVKNHGADGLVLGALTEDGRVDTELCMDLLAASRPLPVTFHRAFDMVHDSVTALEALVSLGFERVLTSGCDSSALEGLPLIKRLVEQAKGRIVIMPGGGITERNLQRILEGSGAQEFHCSARTSKDSDMKFRNTCVTMGASFSAPEYGLKVTDVRKVRSLNAIAKNTL